MASVTGDIDVDLGGGLLADTLLPDGGTLGGFTGISVDATSSVTIGSDADISAASLLVEALSDVQVDAQIAEVTGLLYNDTDIDNSTTVDIAHGATIDIGADAIVGENGESLIVRAVDTSAVNYTIDNAVGFALVPVALDAMLTLVELDRDTEVELGDDSETTLDADFIDADGDVVIAATNAGGIANKILPATYDTNPDPGLRQKNIELLDDDTVVLADGWTKGGIALGVYEWKGGDNTVVDLYNEDYSDTGLWTYLGQKSVVDFFGIASTTMDDNATVDVDWVAVSGASVAADASITAVGETVAKLSYVSMTGGVTASIDNATIAADAGDVRVSATDATTSITEARSLAGM